MKNLTFLICFALVFCSYHSYIKAQSVTNRKFNPNQPIFFTPKNHDPNFLKTGKMPEKSFYQSKPDWQHIIDTTWGPGVPLEQKLLIFNTYAQAVHDYFASFTSWPLSWDSIYNHYLSQITESTSKGAFSAIMNHLSYDLKDVHTYAYDAEVIQSPLNPGVPVLLVGTYPTVEHFGAVTTVLPDSTTLVLRVALNHPLNIEPGDIILGYEGIPWKNLVRELKDAGVPMTTQQGGCKSANTYFEFSAAGMNWHLFDTIDILKYATDDTLHLSVLPLLNLDIPPMANNEQLPVKNIPFPNVLPFPAVSDTLITYGIIENTNIGYIYIVKEDPQATADLQMYNAVYALKNTDALIIDLRQNYGGWAFFEKAFNILFNEQHNTTGDLYRCNTNTFEMCSAYNWTDYQISGLEPDYYDRPIAVLIGPSTISMGDLTAHRLRYHPMVRFFGASPPASFGGSRYDLSLPGWALSYCGWDMNHFKDPQTFINRKEFPIDYPVWFNKDDVAAGIDPIVDKSLEWINNLAYGKNVKTDQWLYSAGIDTAIITATIENPNSHGLSVKLIFESLNGSVVDSTFMSDLQLAGGNQWQGKWKTPGPNDNTYWISCKVTDNATGTYFTNKHATQITTTPLAIDSLLVERLTDTTITIKPFFKNTGINQTLRKLMVNLESNDPWVIKTSPAQIGCDNIKPTLTKGINGLFKVTYNPSIAPDPLYFSLSFSITSITWPFWEIDTIIFVYPVGTKPEKPATWAFSLGQNYPNPFNSATTITWQLAFSSKATLKVYDLLGREVSTLVDEQRPAGNYETRFNAATLPKGIYFYELKAGGFSQTRKMIVLE